jgi:hypothetical protein
VPGANDTVLVSGPKAVVTIASGQTVSVIRLQVEQAATLSSKGTPSSACVAPPVVACVCVCVGERWFSQAHDPLLHRIPTRFAECRVGPTPGRQANFDGQDHAEVSSR